MSNILKIKINEEEHPKAYHPQIVDILQCYMNFPISPECIIRDIVSFVDKPNVLEIGTAITSDMNLTGAGQRSAFFFVQQEGLCRIRLVPVIPGELAKEYVIAILPSE